MNPQTRQTPFAERRERLRDRIPLHRDIPPLIADLAERFDVPVPLPEAREAADRG